MLFVFALSGLARADDLLLDGESATLDGTVSYDTVQLLNGSTLYVTAYDGTGTTGTLEIEANSIYVDGTSTIVATSAGYRGQLNANGEGPGGGMGGSCCMDAGGGGAHGGDGGSGSLDGCIRGGGAGGIAYADSSVLGHSMGSAGGAAGAADGDGGGRGGGGGGSIWLQAAIVEIEGTIVTDGQAGALYHNDAAGGGAGGGVLIVSNTLRCSGSIYARGGDGASIDDGAGGGGGGLVRQLYDASGMTCPVDVSAGSGGCGGVDGSTGIEDSGVHDFDGDGTTAADGDCNPIDPSIHPGATDTWYDGIDSDCAGNDDYDADSDGFDSDAYGGADCNDADASVHPGATDIPGDGIDQDCNGTDASVDTGGSDTGSTGDGGVDGGTPNDGGGITNDGGGMDSGGPDTGAGLFPGRVLGGCGSCTTANTSIAGLWLSLLALAGLRRRRR